MKLRKYVVTTVALFALLSMSLAACGSNGSNGNSAAADGTLVVGADQEPECLDWIATCGGTSWGTWAALVTTLPQAYFSHASSGSSAAYVYEPSPLLAGEATVAPGDKQIITYKLNPAAVWSDGVAITSTDFKYTFDQIMSGNDIYDTTGYVNIESVATPDPATAVVSFKERFAGWKGLFGSGYGIMPSHLLDGKNRNALMKDGYTFSGGPWKLDGGKSGWKKGVSITLVPNENYWGTKATIKKVVFRFITDTSALFQAFKAGEVDFLYPQPQPDWFPAVKGGIDGATIKATADTSSVEALWLNNSKPPFDNESVRKAIAYSLDRDAIVKRLFGPLGVNKAWQSFNPPIVAAYSDPAGFSGYTLDLAKVTELMSSQGYAKGSDGFWAKDGTKVSFTLKTTVGNTRRELTAQILQAAFKTAGFEMKIKTQDAGVLFGKTSPSGDFEMTLFAQVANGPEPGNCAIFCTANIPTEANGGSGNNWTRTNVPGLDELLAKVDIETDTVQRISDSKQADLLTGLSATSIPLDPLPNTLIFRNSIRGPVADNATMGAFWNMNLWTLKG